MLEQRAGAAARAQPAGRPRPGDDLPEVPGEGPAAAVRLGRGAGRRPGALAGAASRSWPGGPSALERAVKWARRRPAIAALLGLLVMSVGGRLRRGRLATGEDRAGPGGARQANVLADRRPMSDLENQLYANQFALAERAVRGFTGRTGAARGDPGGLPPTAARLGMALPEPGHARVPLAPAKPATSSCGVPPRRPSDRHRQRHATTIVRIQDERTGAVLGSSSSPARCRPGWPRIQPRRPAPRR